jgi:tetratricopeptide (TPR) repeat protein
MTVGLALQVQSPPVTLPFLLDAYAAGDYGVISRSLETEATFERMREELDDTSAEWQQRPRPQMAVFLIDLALAAHNRQWVHWLDIICVGRQFVTRLPIGGSCRKGLRPRPVGLGADDDAFEIAWHKTLVALLEGQRRPDFVADEGIGPLEDRMAPAPRPDGDPRLVDPWIAIHRGFVREQEAIVSPAKLEDSGRAAIEQYDEAAEYLSTRTEALVRKGWLLLRLGEPTAALAALESLAEPAADPAVVYWKHLFRARALVALGRQDDAMPAYERARALIPGAQAPVVGLMALELGRDRRAEAYRWAELVRRPPDVQAHDPWWDYWSGDFRFFAGRLVELRRMAR